MPIFTAAATALLAGTALATSTFAVGALAFGLQVGASLALNYAAKALSGSNSSPASANDHFSAQGTLQFGGDVSRSFNFGYSITAGSLVYANTWGDATDTPNAYFTQAIAVSDLPGADLAEVWVNGELCTVGETTNQLLGAPILEYRKEGADHLWIRYHDGYQTSADDLLVTRAASAARPYPATRIGKGVAYVVCTAYVDDTLFTGFPTYKFALSGIPLYDPSKDDTAGGTGSHRWSDKTTWGGDGDNFPAVQIYNILRGISYEGQWLYGLQSMAAARLPVSNWITQINKCREQIVGADGPEPTYRAGGQVNVNTQPANAIEALLTACQGRISEIGGFYKVHLGAPGSPTVLFDDGDILSTEAQNFAPFFPLADSINCISATYPNPAEGWNSKSAPAYKKAELIARDGGRELFASPSFDFVPYAEQVQRLMKSALEEAQRARRHALVMPPAFWLVEPGDVVGWSSARNGYIEKLFRVDGVVDEPTLDVSLNITEVDPSDYDWNSGEFQRPYVGATSFDRPGPQGIRDWFAEGISIDDPNGIARRPAIRLTWDGDVPGVVGVQFEVRNAGDHVVIYRGRTDQLAVGAIIISQSLLADTPYEVRGQYIPSAPRDMLWSDWLSVTTPDVRFGLDDFNAAVRDLYDRLIAAVNERVQPAIDLINLIEAELDASTFLDKYDVRSQMDAIRLTGEGKLNQVIETVDAQFGDANAEITTTKTALANLTSAYSSFETSVTAQFQGVTSSVNSNMTAISTLDTSFGQFKTSVNSQLGSLSSSVTTNATAISSTNASLSSLVGTVQANYNGLSASITTNATAIATVGGQVAARWSLLLDVNNYIVGMESINSGAFGLFRMRYDAIQVAAPGFPDKYVFQLATVNGQTTMAIRGDIVADGTITARVMAAGSITALNGAIDALAVKSLNIGDYAVIVPVVQTGAPFTGNGAYQTANQVVISLETLAGKPYTLYAIWNSAVDYTVTSANQQSILSIDGDSGVVSQSNSPPFTVTLSNGRTFTGTGGVVSHTVTVFWFGETSVVCGSRSLCVWAVKR